MSLEEAISHAALQAGAKGQKLVRRYPNELASVRPIRQHDLLVTTNGRLVVIKQALCAVGSTFYQGDEVWPTPGGPGAMWGDVAYFLLREPA